VTSSDRLYELLGVRPGASRQELKAAYRDLAKVWHPDRFTHDPRLQQKAEEKLKEINKAYEELVSGKTWLFRMTHSSRSPRTVERNQAKPNNTSRVVRVKAPSLIWFLAPLIAFGSVFAFTIRFMRAETNRQSQISIESRASEPDSDSSAEMTTVDVQSGRKAPDTSMPNRQAVEQQRLPTTTVIIDSTTGLLARDECPTKNRMTYPTGSEPRAYCNAHLASRSVSNPQQQSKLKSLQRGTDSSADQPEKNPPEF
jgi:hypothetical protein